MDFLVRYVPGFRELPRRLIEDFEVYFIKEQVTKGYQVQKMEESGDYLFFICRGICKVLFPTVNLPDIFVKSPLFDPVSQKYLVIG